MHWLRDGLVCLLLLGFPIRAAAQDWIEELVKPKGPRRARPKEGEKTPPKKKPPEKTPPPPIVEPRKEAPAPRRGPPRGAALARTWNLCRFERDLDTQVQGALLASDGNVYFFSSTNSVRHGAVAFRFRPEDERLERLCEDVTLVCGERPGGGWSQGIVSTAPVEMDGWVYWGTHSSSAHAPTYPGGHLVGYHLATGRWRDLGVLRPRHTIYAGLAADAQAHRLYVTVSPVSGRMGEPTRLFAVDLPDGKKRDLGVVAYGGPMGYPRLWVDQDRYCWVGAPGGLIVRYNPRRETLEGWLDSLPYLRTPEGFTHIDGGLQSRRRWWWVQGLEQRNRCLLTLQGGTTLYLFSPRHISAGRARAFQIVTRDIGRPGLGCAVSRGRFYFIRRRSSKAARNGFVLELRSVDITRPMRRSRSHGVLADDKGRLAQRIETLLVKEGRRAYLVGDWTTVASDPVSLAYTARGEYVARKTAQCFAAVALSPD